MDKDIRNRIQRATQAARTLLEREYAEQLAGVFDIRADGTMATEPGGHLDAEQRELRTKLMAALDHQRAGGLQPAEAVGSYLREAAFTMLNRFVALKMLEARRLVQECVSRGDQSAGFKEFTGLAPGLVQVTDHGYRLYLESIFDEIGREVRVLFDRRDPAGLLWPRRQALLDLLSILNTADLAQVWKEDETIGWVYQYFNGDDERKKMRAESQAPRNSRELAVRNQFFTPRYVVEFLTDNTLGRIWYEMRQGKTRLINECEYLVRRPNEVFLTEGETTPEDSTAGEDNLSQEEIPKKTFYVLFRAKKDPRDIRVLDPACGSGHFLLYAFDLLVNIYEEGWEDDGGPVSEATGTRLRDDYASLTVLRKALPSLILRHSLHGIDIDPRAAQIAALALWMRAQRAYNDFGIPRDGRPTISKTNIVVAEPMPGEKELRREFVASLDSQLGKLVERVFEKMELAGEAGALLKIGEEIRTAIEEVYGGSGQLFRRSDEDRWQEAESQLLAALARYDASASSARRFQRRLFAGDAARGFGLIDVSSRVYDVVVMNPPFGKFIDKKFTFIDGAYPTSKRDVGVAFIDRALTLTTNGLIGALFSRRPLFITSQKDWRASIQGSWQISTAADLGLGVLDDALVEVIAAVFAKGAQRSVFVDCLSDADKQMALTRKLDPGTDQVPGVYHVDARSFERLPERQYAYFAPQALLNAFKSKEPLEPALAYPRIGLQSSDDFRFLRLWWELPYNTADRKAWVPVSKGGEYAPYYSDLELCVLWQDGHGEMAAYSEAGGNEARSRQGSKFYFRPGLTYTERTASRLSVRILPRNCLFSVAGPGIIPKDDQDLPIALALANSLCFSALVELCLGSGDSVSSGTAARHYTAGMLSGLPIPSQRDLARVGDYAWTMADAFISVAAHHESSPLFVGLPESVRRSTTLREASLAWYEIEEESALKAIDVSFQAEKEVAQAYALTLDEVAMIVGPHPGAYADSAQEPNALSALYLLPDENLVREVSSICGNSRSVVVKSYIADRRLELVAHALRAHPVSIACLRRLHSLLPPGYMEHTRHGILSFVVGCAWGRWHTLGEEGHPSARALTLDGMPGVPPACGSPMGPAIFTDDEGDDSDVVANVAEAWQRWHGRDSDDFFQEVVDHDARSYFRDRFFEAHIRSYSKHRRSAPIYWQLATRSVRYSVWIHYHQFTKDSFYRILNDHVSPKVQHEELKLTRLVQGARGRPSASQRQEIAEQESFVEELRAFRDEVARIAPLWNPNLNDGVILNFAPLWRLVPQHRAWQKECKECWDKLVAGDYDWGHLAMHLWPERVIPKCADDRSLAIAHGLEEIFWVEGSDGDWQKRKVDQAVVSRLIAERTAPAVKDALKSLLGSPVPGTGREGGRRGATPRQAAAVRRSPRQTSFPSTTADLGSDAISRVREAIAGAMDGVSKADVLAATGITDLQWSAAINALLSQGLVTKTGEQPKARYRIVETGGRT